VCDEVLSVFCDTHHQQDRHMQNTLRAGQLSRCTSIMCSPDCLLIPVAPRFGICVHEYKCLNARLYLQHMTTPLTVFTYSEFASACRVGCSVTRSSWAYGRTQSVARVTPRVLLPRFASSFARKAQESHYLRDTNENIGERVTIKAFHVVSSTCARRVLY
jgi:hypothetical protein